MRLPTGHTLKFQIGQIVYLVTDPNQLPRMVLGIKLLPGNQVLYSVYHERDGSEHYDIEMSPEPNLLVRLTQ